LQTGQNKGTFAGQMKINTSFQFLAILCIMGYMVLASNGELASVAHSRPLARRQKEACAGHRTEPKQTRAGFLPGDDARFLYW
jgi:hypothetical protein